MSFCKIDKRKLEQISNFLNLSLIIKCSFHPVAVTYLTLCNITIVLSVSKSQDYTQISYLLRLCLHKLDFEGHTQKLSFEEILNSTCTLVSKNISLTRSLIII